MLENFIKKLDKEIDLGFVWQQLETPLCLKVVLENKFAFRNNRVREIVNFGDSGDTFSLVDNEGCSDSFISRQEFVDLFLELKGYLQSIGVVKLQKLYGKNVICSVSHEGVKIIGGEHTYKISDLLQGQAIDGEIKC